MGQFRAFQCIFGGVFGGFVCVFGGFASWYGSKMLFLAVINAKIELTQKLSYCVKVIFFDYLRYALTFLTQPNTDSIQ